jgi:chitodextrinase
MVAPRDTAAPTAPGTPTSSGNTGNTVNLSWPAATDNVGVTGYQVFRDGTLLRTVSGTTYTDTSAATGTTYSYTVKARDAAGLVSPSSPALSVTTHLVNTAAWYTMKNLNSGNCITAAGTGDTAALQAAPCAVPAGADQAFRFTPTGTGAYFVELRALSTKVWDVSGASTADNGQVFVYGNHGGTNQQWKLTKHAVNGSFSMANVNSTMCVQFAGGSAAVGAQLQQATCAATDFQRFSLAVAQ